MGRIVFFMGLIIPRHGAFFFLHGAECLRPWGSRIPVLALRWILTQSRRETERAGGFQLRGLSKMRSITIPLRSAHKSHQDVRKWAFELGLRPRPLKLRATPAALKTGSSKFLVENPTTECSETHPCAARKGLRNIGFTRFSRKSLPFKMSDQDV